MNWWWNWEGDRITQGLVETLKGKASNKAVSELWNLKGDCVTHGLEKNYKDFKELLNTVEYGILN